MMYQLVTLRDEPPDELYPPDAQGNRRFRVTPFLPPFTLDGGPAAGYTFGPNLRAYSNNSEFSESLTDLIYQCLYEDPRNRPTLEDLKTRIALASEAAFADPIQSVVDPWADFHFAPFVNLNLPAARTGKRRRGADPANRPAGTDPLEFFPRGTRMMICQCILPNGKQCRRTFRAQPLPFPRCGICVRQGR